MMIFVPNCPGNVQTPQRMGLRITHATIDEYIGLKKGLSFFGRRGGMTSVTWQKCHYQISRGDEAKCTSENSQTWLHATTAVQDAASHACFVVLINLTQPQNTSNKSWKSTLPTGYQRHMSVCQELLPLLIHLEGSKLPGALRSWDRSDGRISTSLRFWTPSSQGGGNHPNLKGA